MRTLDTLIIGGGIAGASLACSLAERNAGSGVAIVDPQLYGKWGSSELNGGGVRCTFAEPINIKLSLASSKYYQQLASKLEYRQRGYLWMYDQKLWEEAKEFLPLVRSFGLSVEELSPDQARGKFPVLSDVSDLAGVTFTPMDGRLSPHRLRMHYLNRAAAGGVELLDRFMVVGIEGERSPFTVRLRRVEARNVKKVLMGEDKAAEAAMPLLANRVVNAAGAWAPSVTKLYGRTLPITPMPRQVFLLKHPGIDLEAMPFFIDYPQEIYFRHLRRQGQSLTLVSWSDPSEPHRIDFSFHGQSYFEKHVKPRLVRRAKEFADAELVGGWVGHYELSTDKSAIVGAVPGREGLFNLNGLSAHGVMQSRGLGEAMAELLTHDCWPADLNLDELSESRFQAAAAIAERMYV